MKIVLLNPVVDVAQRQLAAKPKQCQNFMNSILMNVKNKLKANTKVK